MTIETTTEIPATETKKPTHGKKTGAKKGATAKKKASKTKGNKANGSAFQKAGKVGIIDTIIAECSKPNGATKTEVLERLTKKFPDRPAKGMRATIHIYLGGRLNRDKGYKIRKTGEGKQATYRVTPPKPA